MRAWDAPSPAATPLDNIAILSTYRRGECVCGASKPNGALHRVVSGAAKTLTLLPGGRQQTMDLLLAGDFFALDCRYTDSLVVEALGRISVIAEYRQPDIETLAAHRPDLRAFLTDVAFGNARRLQSRMLTMSHLRTTQKVGAFLLELSERLPGRSTECITLPVSRYDIADYLGIAVESVSRSLSKLKGEGAIRMLGTRRVLITDREAMTAATFHPAPGEA